MSAAVLPISSNAPNGEHNTPKVPENDPTGRFHALLDQGIGNILLGVNTQAEAKYGKPSEKNKAGTDVNVLDIPLPIVTPSAKASKSDSVTSKDSKPSGNKDTDVIAPRRNTQAEKNAAPSNSSQTEPAPKPQERNIPEKTVVKTETTKNISKNTPEDEEDKGQYATLRDQIKSIDQLLLAIIDALSGITPPQTTTPEIGSSANTSIVLAAQTSSPDPSGSNALSPSAATDATALASALLQDAQTLLQHIQTLFPSGTAEASAQSQASSAEELNASIGTLTHNITTLSTLLSKVSENPDAIHTISSTQISASFSTLQAELKALSLSDDKTSLEALKEILPALKEGVLQIKEHVQTLTSQDASVAAQAKITLPVPVSDSTALTTQAIPDTAPTIPAAPTPVLSYTAQNALVKQDSSASADAGNATFMGNTTITTGSGNQSSGNNANYNQQGQQSASPTITAAGSQNHSPTGTTTASFTQIANKSMASPAMDQVLFQVKKSLTTGNSRIHIQLDPVELGKVDIRLRVGVDGKTDAVITVDNKQTLELLQRDAQSLARALSDAGLSADMGNLNFNLRQGREDSSQNQPTQAAQTYRKAQPEEEDLSLNMITRSYTVNLAEGLDIKI